MSKSSLGRLGLLFVSLLGLMSLFSAPAFAAGKPVVTVSPASNKSLNTATANGTVNPNGASTTYKFEYGKTTLYGKSTTVTSAGNGTTPVSVNAVLAGLEPLTTYHYRVSATNSFGTTVSEDVIFEMLLSWKVDGVPISEIAGNVEYNLWDFEQTALAVEGTTKGGTAVKLTCKGDKFGAFNGVLGASHQFSFTGCKTLLNGTESKPCAVAPFSLKLNGLLVPTSNIELGEECSIGSSIPLTSSGFAVGAMAEAQYQAVTLTEQVPFGTMTATISNPKWFLVGKDIGKKFGIS